MVIALFITLAALVTAIVATIAAKDVIWDPAKKSRVKLKGHGYVFIICAILMVIFPLVQYYFQSKQDDQKENKRKTEQAKRDRELRIEYEASVSQIRRDFGDSNYRTLTVIGNILSIQRDSLDIANKRIIKLMHDSGNIKTVLPDQPVLDVINMQEGKEGFKYIKYEDGVYHYSINILSQDGASCCYNLKLSAVALDSASNQLAYIGPIRSGLTATDDLAKFGAYQWTFQIDYPRLYDWLYLWVRGTYSDREGKHTYTIDKVYYNRKGPNTGGSMGGNTRKSVIYIVHLFEK
jgi:hypothetical protein